MFHFYVLRFFKNGDTIQGGTLFKGGHYLRKYGIFALKSLQNKNDVKAARFLVFFAAGSWEKDTENRAAVTSLRSFLFHDDFSKIRFLENLCIGTQWGGFQFLLILDLLAIGFHDVVVFGLVKDLLFKSFLGHCRGVLVLKHDFQICFGFWY